KSGRASCERRPEGLVSAAESEPLDNFLVLLRLGRLQVVQQLAALVHHLHQPAAGSLVALVRGEGTAQAGDALGQKCDLYFRRPRILRVAAVLLEDAALGFGSQCHLVSFWVLLKSRAFYPRTPCPSSRAKP